MEKCEKEPDVIVRIIKKNSKASSSIKECNYCKEKVNMGEFYEAAFGFAINSNTDGHMVSIDYRCEIEDIDDPNVDDPSYNAIYYRMKRKTPMSLALGM